MTDWADFKNGWCERRALVKQIYCISLFFSFPGCLAGQIPDLEHSAHPHLLCVSWWQQWRCRWNHPVWQLWGDCAWRWVNFSLSPLSPEFGAFLFTHFEPNWKKGCSIFFIKVCSKIQIVDNVQKWSKIEEADWGPDPFDVPVTLVTLSYFGFVVIQTAMKTLQFYFYLRDNEISEILFLKCWTLKKSRPKWLVSLQKWICTWSH